MAKTIALIVLVLFSQVHYGQCGDRYQNEIFSSISISTVNYSDVYSDNAHMMDIYTADSDTFTNRPVIIFQHGGSYYSGSKESLECVEVCNYFAKRGYVAISMNYRLVSLSNLANFLSSNTLQYEEVLKATADMKGAIRYMRKDATNGNNFGINSNSIFVGGFSSGAITAIHTAYIDNISDLPTTPINAQIIANNLGGIEGDVGNIGYSSAVNGIINFAGGIHLLQWIDSNDEPIFSAQGTNDLTVNFNCGPGLNIPNVLELCGLAKIHPICDSLGINNQSLIFNNTDHLWSQNQFNQALDQSNSFLYPLLPCNNISSFKDIYKKRVLLKTINLLGQEASPKNNEPLFYIYNDGSVEKIIYIK